MSFDQNFYARQIWDQWKSYVLTLPPHVEAPIPLWGTPHPLQAGFVYALGDAAGQKANYRLPLDDGTDRELHAKEFDDHYTLHWDLVSAIRKPLGHIVADAPHWIGKAVIGGLVAAGIGLFLWALKDDNTHEDEV